MHIGILWVLLEKFGAAFLSVAVFFIYAKFLSTEEMGIAIVILSVTQFLALLINTFFEDALVQKEKITQQDIDTTFWVSNALSVMTTVLTCAGFWAWGKTVPDHPILAMSCFATLEIIFTNLTTTYVAQLRREGKFKVLAFRVILGRIGGSLIGLICILAHLGPWSILAQSVMGMGFQLAILLYAVCKIPGHDIHLHLIKDNFHFGLMLALRRLSWDALVRMTPIAAGIVGGTSMAGIVGFAWRIVELPRSSISSGLSSYLLPLLSRERSNIPKMANSFLSITGMNALFMTPLFLGLYLIAPNLIQGIFDDKWAETASIIQMFSLAALISCYRIPASVSTSAAGQPGKMLITDAVSSVLTIVIMLAFGMQGAWVIGFAHILFNLMVLPKGFSILKNIMNLSVADQIRPVLYYALPGNLMFILLYIGTVLMPHIPPLTMLVMQISCGAVLFCGFATAFYKPELAIWISNLKRKKVDSQI